MRLGNRGGLSARTLILALVAMIVLPGIAFTSLIIYRYAQAEVRVIASRRVPSHEPPRRRLTARINGIITVLQTLSSSAYLAVDDIPGFRAQVLSVKGLSGLDIGLRELDGQILFNTRVPDIAPLTKATLPIDATVIETRQPAVSGVLCQCASPEAAFRGRRADHP